MHVQAHPRAGDARWLVVAFFGVMGGLGGIRHGIGEVRQGSTATSGLMFDSWTQGPIATNMDGEPAFSLVPNTLATGILAIVVSAAVIGWSLFYLRSKHGGLGLVLLSLLMFLVGGGVGPPVVALLAGLFGFGLAAQQPGRVARWSPGARHALARIFPWIFVVAVLNGLLLFVVSVVLVYAIDFDNADVFLGSFFLAIVTVIASAITAAAYDAERTGVASPLPGAAQDNRAYGSGS